MGHTEPDVALSDDLPGRLDGWERLVATYPELETVGAAVAEHTPVYLVGGLVRDLASGMDPKDIDITSALTPSEFRAAVTGVTKQAGVSVFDVGEEHGTTGISFLRSDGTRVEIEHTTHRTETYEPGSRTPTVGFGASLEDDLARRDFTINAVAVDVMTGEVVDPFGGLNDLDARTLRTPADPVRTFTEDPLRISRLVRFAAVRDFDIDRDTAVAASLVSPELANVSAERKRDELVKVADAGMAATARALAVCDALGLRQDVFCGLGDRASAFDFVELELRDRSDVLAALSYRSSDGPGAMTGLKFTNAERGDAEQAASAARYLTTDTDPVSFRRFLRRNGAETVGRAARIRVGDRFSSDDRSKVERALGDNEGFDVQPLPVDGRDALAAGLKGPAVGARLAAVEAAMCEDPGLSRRDALGILGQLPT